MEQVKLKGEGVIERISRIRVRKRCELCDGVAKYKHTYLLEGMRNNPASSAYCKDDCSWCEDAAIFTCGSCKPETPGGHVQGSRFECSDRFAHIFLEWENIDGEDEYHKMVKAVDAVCDLIGESEGVTGLHLNGDIATWGELLRGGAFEEWLSALSDVIGERGRRNAIQDQKAQA